MRQSNFATDLLCAFTSAVIAQAPLIWLFWPGILSPDSIDQIFQATGKSPLLDNHPVSMTLLIRIFANITTGTFRYLIFQGFITALCVALGTVFIQRSFFKNIRRKFLFLCIIPLIFCMTPPSALINVTIWKDVPFNWLIFLQTISTSSLIAFFNPNMAQRSESEISLRLFVAMTSGALALHFRHNAFTVVFPMAALAIGIYLGLSRRTPRSVLKTVITIILCGITFFSIYYGRVFLVKTYVQQESTSNNLSTHLYERTFVNDFMQAYLIGMPVTQDQIITINQWIDWEIESNKVDIGSSYQQNAIVYKNPEARYLFGKFALMILKEHPKFWALAKASYGKSLINSRKGYQIPLPYFEKYSRAEYGLNLTMNEELQFARETFRIAMGRESGSHIMMVLLFWTFYPVALFHVISTTQTIYSAMISKKLTMEELSLLAQFFSIACLCVPLWLMSATNDFRYFWPAMPITFVSLMIYFKNIRIASKFTAPIRETLGGFSKFLKPN